MRHPSDYYFSGAFSFIQLFADGGTGDGGAVASGQTGAAPAQPQTAETETSLAGVRYGRREAAPDAGEQSVDRSAAFDELIKGEYKDVFEARIKDIVGRRLKSTEAIVASYNELAPTIETLNKKYGVKNGDIKALNKAIEDDESFYEDEALESGLTVQQVKENRRIQRENAALRQQLDEIKNRESGERVLAEWQKQGEALKAVYPAFDLKAELQNETFRNLLSSNVPLRTAFEVIHKDEILPAAMQYSAKQAEAKVAASVRANRARPQEGAMGNASAVSYKSDVSQLTDADMVEINRRVMRGERISF